MNMCSIRSDSRYQKYNDILQMAGFKQLISTPTRVTDTSSTAIDHILCNNMHKINHHGVIPSGLSDHYITYCTKKNIKNVVNSHKGIKIRSLKKYSKECFVEMLQDVDWSSVYKSVNVNQSWLCFRNLFTSVIDSVAPFKEVRIKHHSEPWISLEILESMRERDSWLSKSRKNKHNTEHYQKYRQLRNKVQNDIKSAKRQYMLNKIDENKNNPKQLWKNLKDIGYQSNPKESTNIVLDVDGTKLYDKKSVAGHFNHFLQKLLPDWSINFRYMMIVFMM